MKLPISCNCPHCRAKYDRSQRQLTIALSTILAGACWWLWCMVTK